VTSATLPFGNGLSLHCGKGGGTSGGAARRDASVTVV